MSRLYGLIGFPLGHSRSAEYFNGRFIQEGPEDAHYRLFPIPSLLELPHILAEHPDLRGFNVTIPYKEKIIPLLAEMDDVAREIGSVNVVTIKRDGEQISMKGYNTDAEGFVSSLPDISAHMHALILGTGGSARTVAYALSKKGTGVLFASRTKSGNGIVSYKTLKEDPLIIERHSLIINTTPLGMFPNTDSCPDLPFERIGPKHLLYDLVYNPSGTLFLQKGASRGAMTLTGEAMFLKQAELTFEIFRTSA